MRVLVVDDNQELAENLAEILVDEGHEATVAAGAEDTLSIDECFDLALLDVRMDGVDGVELLRRIRARCPSTNCVMMTAFTRDERLDEARDLGAVVLQKPVRVEELLALVDAA
ncbi:MAG: response regulator [Myxococcota bacterium]